MFQKIHFLSLAGLLLAICCAEAEAQEQNPVEAALKRMRESLRTTMAQLQAAEAEKAALQAAQAENEAKMKQFTAELDSLKKKAANEKAASDKSIFDLNSKIANQSQEIAVQKENLTKLSETLEKWKAGYNKAAGLARTKDAERAKLQSKVIVLERTVADRETKNAELFRTANEILSRYENFGLGRALVAREPFVGITRVKLENLVQDYRDRILDNKVRPGEPVAEAASPPPASAQDTAAKPAAPAPQAQPPSPASSQKPSKTKARS